MYKYVIYLIDWLGRLCTLKQISQLVAITIYPHKSLRGVSECCAVQALHTSRHWHFNYGQKQSKLLRGKWQTSRNSLTLLLKLMRGLKFHQYL